MARKTALELLKASYFAGRTLSIGLDPGSNLGFAVWDRGKKVFHMITSSSFAPVISTLGWMVKVADSLEASIEDPSLMKIPVFQGKQTGRAPVDRKIAEKVGRVKENGILLIECCEYMGISVERVHPGANLFIPTKSNAAFFRRVTGFTGSTNEHGRDAARLVFGK